MARAILYTKYILATHKCTAWSQLVLYGGGYKIPSNLWYNLLVLHPLGVNDVLKRIQQPISAILFYWSHQPKAMRVSVFAIIVPKYCDMI